MLVDIAMIDEVPDQIEATGRYQELQERVIPKFLHGRVRAYFACLLKSYAFLPARPTPAAIKRLSPPSIGIQGGGKQPPGPGPVNGGPV